jgi:hypothetical protein
LTPEIHGLRRKYASGVISHYNRHPAYGKTPDPVTGNSSLIRINFLTASMKKYHPDNPVFLPYGGGK